jgi:photosystem II stability/assembly factor-like uncharacterized protein
VPEQIYVTAYPLGLLESRDCGQTWTTIPINIRERTFDRIARRVTSGPAHRLYVDRDGTYSVTSPDGGSSWESVRLEHPGFPNGAGGKASRFVVDPDRQGVAYTYFDIFNMRGPAGLYRTEDGGRWWRSTGSSRSIVPLALGRDKDSLYFHGGTALLHSVLPARWETPIETVRDFGSHISAVTQTVDKSHLWVATEDGLLHLSRDQGATWMLISTKGGPVTPFIDLAFSPFDPTVIYAVNVVGEIWTYREPK